MSYRHTYAAALESLHEIEELMKGFPGEGKIPAIEIDLTLQKLRNLYELMLMLRDKETESTQAVVTTIISTTQEVEREMTVKEVEVKVPPPVKKPEAEKSVRTIADQFKSRTTLYESLHQTFQGNESVSQGKPIIDLMSAIGLNDRFTFIRELFGNDQKVFESTISELNSATSFNDAYNYMTRQFNWDMDGEAVQLLLDIIRRKYIKGRHE